MFLRAFTRLVALAALLIAVPLAHADELAQVYSVQGEVEVHPLSGDWKPVAINDRLEAGSVIRTKAGARVAIVLPDGVLVRLGENSSLALPGPQKTALALNQGDGYFLSREKREFPIINTPVVSAAVRGTEFVMKVSDARTEVSVLDGRVDCQNDFGRVSLSRGEQSETLRGHAPTKSIIVNPVDAVQWALRYPVPGGADSFAALQQKLELRGKNSFSSSFARSVQKLREGDSVGASKSLSAEIPKDLPAPLRAEVLVYQSFLALSRADVAGAEAKLNAASKVAGGVPLQEQGAIIADIKAQQAVIALAKNDKAAAERLSSEAAASAPDSIAARTTRSIVYQSNFDLERADQELAAVLARDPGNVFALTRRAELLLGQGEIEKAKELLGTASRISPEDSYVLSVRGFAALVEGEPEEAEEPFRRAVANDPDAGLPHLGLGLTMIRRGDLEGGRKEIEKAAHLEPTVSIYRSYLGKAFFEGDDEQHAANEYTRAIELDPRDPTPYLYRAFNSVTVNDPVNALRDIEESITVNDNRAVYRSSLLLDEDVAVRSSGLSEIFNVLGFSQAARVEAIKSINRDYSNYSAHRLLSSSYENLFLVDSSLSESRIASLLSPLSFNVFRGAGKEASFGDYTALFDKDETRVGLAGSATDQDDALFQQGSVAGKQGKFGYFASYAYAGTGGSRDGHFTRDNEAQVAGQYQPDYKNLLLLDATGRKIESQTGDFEALNSDDTEKISASIGYRHEFDSRSTFLAQVAYLGNRDFNDNFTERALAINSMSGGEIFDSSIDNALLREMTREKGPASLSNLQYIYTGDIFTAIAGAEYYNGRFTRSEDSEILADEVGYFTGAGQHLFSRAIQEPSYLSQYLYTTFHLQQWADLTLGVTHADIGYATNQVTPFVDTDTNQHRFSPKFGITLYPDPSLTVRGAYFETLRSPSFENYPGIEPTLIGGINQLYTDFFSGSLSQNAGAGIDYKLSKRVYFGIEALHRNIGSLVGVNSDVITLDFDTGTGSADVESIGNLDLDQTQQIGRAYLSTVLADRVVDTLDYRVSESQFAGGADAARTLTHRVGNSVRYFDSSGIFLDGTASWHQQSRRDNSFVEDGSDAFWLFDAAVGYRLPHRHGTMSFVVNNIFDKSFTFDEFSASEEFLSPERSLRFQYAVNF